MAGFQEDFSLISLLKTSAEVAVIYPRQNPTVGAKLDQLHKKIVQMRFEKGGELALEWHSKGISINGQNITNVQLSRPQSQYFLTIHRNTNCLGLIFKKDPEKNQLYELGKWLHKATQLKLTFDEFQTALAPFIADTILLIPPGGFANTPAQPGPSSATNEAPPASASEHMPELENSNLDQSFKGLLKPSVPNVQDRLFEMTNSEKIMLSQNVGEWVQRQEFDRILAAAEEFLNGLSGMDPGAALMSAKKLHFFILQVDQANSAEIIVALFRTIDRALGTFPRDEIFEQALHAWRILMKSLRRQNQLGTFIEGMVNLLQLIRLQKAHRQELMTQTLNALLDHKLMEFFLELAHAGKPISSQIQNFFLTFHKELIRPLLQVLYFSQQQSVRRQALSLLVKTGKEISPIVITDLDKAMQQRTPWYVKRNLLTLLIKFPHPDLAKYVRALAEDPDERVQEQLLLAMMTLKSPATVEMAMAKLTQQPMEMAQKSLKIAARCSNGLYEPFFSRLFFQVEDLEFQKEILVAMGRFHTKGATEFLYQVISEKKLLSYRFPKELRVLATKSLSENLHASAVHLLYNLRNNKEEEIQFFAKRRLAKKGEHF
jgi:hypothetical protein